jgi:hypothetical protein
MVTEGLLVTLREALVASIQISPGDSGYAGTAWLLDLNDYEAGRATLTGMPEGDPGAPTLVSQLFSFLEDAWRRGWPVSGRVIHTEKVAIYAEASRIMGAAEAARTIPMNDGLTG